MLILTMEHMSRSAARSHDPRQLEQLLLAVARGEQQALAQLYEQTRGAVYGFALSYLKHAQDAQDITQDVFVRVWESAGQYRPQGKPMAWLLAVTRNLSLMRLREAKRIHTMAEEEWDAIPSPSPAVTPEERDLLQTALATLSERERQLVILHAAAGLKHRQAAQVMGLPLSTALSLYHRALKKLKKHMEGEEDA